MLFNSVAFLIFFPIVAALYFIVPSRHLKNLALLAASFYFYMWEEPRFAIFILISILITYATGIWIARAKTLFVKRCFVSASLFLNLGILITLKYSRFISESLSAFLKLFSLSWSAPTFKFLIPIGISFYTFKALSYTLDVYKGSIKPERNIFTYALFVSFFPQLLSGPIERAWHFLPQFYEDHKFDYKRITDGIKLITWGYFLKFVIADKCAILVDAVYGNPQAFSGLTLILGTMLFVVQVYCDLAGYTNIAIGAADILGFQTIKNFDRPYFSTSIGDLWRRWHISMMSWFRDYLYIPLGGNRVSRVRHHFNTILTFVLSGLWHGANWTYVFWGGLNGVLIIISTRTERIREKIRDSLGINKAPRFRKIYQILITMMLFSFGAVFFRARSFADAIYIITHLFDGLAGQLINIANYRLNIGMSWGKIVVMVISILIWIVLESKQRKGSIRQRLNAKPVYIRYAAYYGLILWVLLFGEFESKSFIYFQF